MDEDSFKGKRVLITGGCGFIGFHLIKRMLNERASVFIMDRKNADTWRIKNIMHEIKIFEADITDAAEVDRSIKQIKPDYVFHLAAYGVDSLQREYIAAAKTNIMGTINMLNSLKDAGCNKIINMGSCAEYGDRRETMNEDMNPVPVSIYGSTKACATIIAHQIARENNMDIVTLRPFGIFGEGEERHKIFCHIILSILEGKDVRLTCCDQCRDYCYIENIIDGMLLAAQNRLVKNAVFNIASGNLYPLKYYVELIFKNMHTDRRPLYGEVEYRKDEMWAPKADIKRIQTELNWKAKIGLEEGIINTIEWYELNKGMYLDRR